MPCKGLLRRYLHFTWRVPEWGLRELQDDQQWNRFWREMLLRWRLLHMTVFKIDFLANTKSNDLPNWMGTYQKDWPGRVVKNLNASDNSLNLEMALKMAKLEKVFQIVRSWSVEDCFLFAQALALVKNLVHAAAYIGRFCVKKVSGNHDLCRGLRWSSL